MASYTAANEAAYWRTVQDFVLFGVSVGSGTLAVWVFLVFLVSSVKQGWYFQKITNLAEAATPQLEALDETRTFVPIPVLKKNQSQAISLIIDALMAAGELVRTIHFDYRTGGITDQHHTHLLTTLRGITEGERNLVGN